jgi:hypothetical protein
MWIYETSSSAIRESLVQVDAHGANVALARPIRVPDVRAAVSGVLGSAFPGRHAQYGAARRNAGSERPGARPLSQKNIMGRWKMSELNAVVAVYDTHIGAEQAVMELQRTGIDMRTLSIAGKDPHTDEHVVGYYNTGDRP